MYPSLTVILITAVLIAIVIVVGFVKAEAARRADLRELDRSVERRPLAQPDPYDQDYYRFKASFKLDNKKLWRLVRDVLRGRRWLTVTLDYGAEGGEAIGGDLETTHEPHFSQTKPGNKVLDFDSYRERASNDHPKGAA